MNKNNLKLKFTIKGLGLTQEEIANEIGISVSYFNRLITKPLKPRLKVQINDAIETLVNEHRKQQDDFLELLASFETSNSDSAQKRDARQK